MQRLEGTLPESANDLTLEKCLVTVYDVKRPEFGLGTGEKGEGFHISSLRLALAADTTSAKRKRIISVCNS